MRVLIGTPIHISKDYSMEKWLENVSCLEYPADLFLVDNSPDISYVEKVKGYCAKYKITNYKIEHLEIDQNLKPAVRVEISEEIIRRYVLSHGYDAWFSWECDQIIPANALSELIRLMTMGNYMMVIHNSWARWDPAMLNTDMGITLIKRECLKKNRFWPEHKGKISIDPKERYNVLFKKRVLRSGGNYIEVFGIIAPVYHLDNNPGK